MCQNKKVIQNEVHLVKIRIGKFVHILPDLMFLPPFEKKCETVSTTRHNVRQCGSSCMYTSQDNSRPMVLSAVASLDAQ